MQRADREVCRECGISKPRAPPTSSLASRPPLTTPAAAAAAAAPVTESMIDSVVGAFATGTAVVGVGTFGGPLDAIEVPLGLGAGPPKASDVPSCSVGAEAVYQHRSMGVDLGREVVTVVKVHSHAEGGGVLVYIPSRKCQRDTHVDRLEFDAAAVCACHAAGAAHSTSSSSSEVGVSFFSIERRCWMPTRWVFRSLLVARDTWRRYWRIRERRKGNGIP